MNEKSPFRSFVLKARPIRRSEHSRPSTGKRNDSTIETPRQLIIGGIVFIQGAPEAVQQFFREKSLFFTLVHDCATQRPAVLPDELMRPLRQVVELAAERISFLPKPFAHYAEGHVLVRVVEGPLKGLQGCIMRINRDRKLVMQVGKLTLAIARAHREVFEAVVQEEDNPPTQTPQRKLTYLQEELDKNLFFPQTQAEVGMYADNVALLMNHATRLLTPDAEENASAATAHGPCGPRQELGSDMLLFLLEEIAYHFDSPYPVRRFDTPYPARRFDLTPIQAVGQKLTATIRQLASPADSRLPESEKERLSVKCDAITLGKDYLFQRGAQ